MNIKLHSMNPSEARSLSLSFQTIIIFHIILFCHKKAESMLVYAKLSILLNMVKRYSLFNSNIDNTI